MICLTSETRICANNNLPIHGKRSNPKYRKWDQSDLTVTTKYAEYTGIRKWMVTGKSANHSFNCYTHPYSHIYKDNHNLYLIHSQHSYREGQHL